MLIRPKHHSMLVMRPVSRLVLPLRRSHAGLLQSAQLRLLAVRVFSSKAVVVVESPTKAKKIQQFLGEDYKVLASYGHVRDLPPRTGSVLPDQDFELRWELSRGAGPRLAEIEQALREQSGAGRGRRGAAPAAGGPALVLATDPDREGEAISWHLLEELQRRGAISAGSQVQRITFTEITKAAVLHALATPRQVSVPLVDAYLARRALDYLVGFGISPVLWRRLPGARSAGRVQSVALRLVSEREEAIEQFQPQEYWTVDVQLEAQGGKVVTASLIQVDGVKLNPLTGIPGKLDADQLVARIRAAAFTVSNVGRKEVQRSPSPPFTTATLQQEASRKLGFSASRTMKVAQELYEGAGTGEGLITYMRTDGLQMSGEAVAGLRAAAKAAFGPSAIPDKPRFYKSRAKNAQEAHEAVRPTRPALLPSKLPAALGRDLRALYELIWRRSLACQMSNAVMDQVSVDFQSQDKALKLRATGSAVLVPGYLQVYDRHYPTSAEQEDEAPSAGTTAQGTQRSGSGAAAAAVLASLKAGEAVDLKDVLPDQHFTKPPGRYTDASLIKELEQKGIGRPSTYASILTVLQTRGYILKSGRALEVSPLGRVLSTFLTHYFPTYVDYSFTSDMEEQLDEVSGGRSEWKALMHSFWGPFSSAVQGMTAISITDVFNVLDQELEHVLFKAPVQPQLEGAGADSEGAPSATAKAAADPRVCPSCGSGRLVLKPSRSGGFIGCTNFNAGCKYARPLQLEEMVLDEETGQYVRSEQGGRMLGVHPDSGLPIVVKKGPYGAYVEIVGSDDAAGAAEAGEAGHLAAEEGGAELAVDGGGQEEAGAEVDAEAEPGVDGKGKAKGRKKKAVKVKAVRVKKVKVVAPKPRRAALPKGKEDSISLEEAVRLLELPRFLGLHPEDQQPVQANIGRFGPYVMHQAVFASLGRSLAPQQVTLDQAVQLLQAKREKLQGQAARGKGRAAKKAPAGRTKAGKGKAVGKELAVGRKAKAGKAVAEQGGGEDEGGGREGDGNGEARQEGGAQRKQAGRGKAVAQPKGGVEVDGVGAGGGGGGAVEGGMESEVKTKRASKSNAQPLPLHEAAAAGSVVEPVECEVVVRRRRASRATAVGGQEAPAEIAGQGEGAGLPEVVVRRRSSRAAAVGAQEALVGGVDQGEGGGLPEVVVRKQRSGRAAVAAQMAPVAGVEQGKAEVEAAGDGGGHGEHEVKPRRTRRTKVQQQQEEVVGLDSEEQQGGAGGDEAGSGDVGAGDAGSKARASTKAKARPKAAAV